MLPVSKYHRSQKRFSLLRGSVKLKLTVSVILIFFSLIFTQLVFANSLATDGQKLSGIKKEIQKLEDENTTLKAKIAQESSLSSLMEKARELGFKKPQKLTIL